MKILSVFLALCLFSLPCAAQTRWPIAQLHYIQTKNQIAASRLESSERAALRSVLCRIAEIGNCQGDSVFNSFQIERASLTAGKKDGLAIQGVGSELCGASGNCAFLVLDKEMRVFLSTYGVQMFAITKELSNGRFDIVTSQHDSANESTLRRYRFDGNKYHSVQCADLEYGSLTNPNGPPHLTAISCVNSPEER